MAQLHIHSCSMAFLEKEVLSEQVEVLTEGVTREDKVLVISLAIFLSLAAGLLLGFMPAQYLDFQWESATAELGWLVTSLRRKLDVHMMVNALLTGQMPALSVFDMTCSHKLLWHDSQFC